jgi:carbon starvation protein
MIYGWLVNKRGFSFTGAGIGALVFLVLLFVLGMRIPVTLPVGPAAAMQIWTAVLLIYGSVAAILPVWLLLQPRDFIASWMLAGGMLAGFGGLFMTHKPIFAPMMTGAVSPSQGPVWPMLFILIACGAVSGFHSLVSSGTTAKQLTKESDGKSVGFGAMITEGALALLALLAVSAGLSFSNDGSDPSLSSFLAPNGAGAIGAFAAGFGVFTEPFMGAAGALFGMMMLNSFVLTTLDTSVRLARFISVELMGPSVALFKNRYVATIVPALCAYALAATGSQSSLWPMFGAANQLIAALAMIVVTVYFAKLKKPKRYTLIPAVFMWVTTCAALAWKGAADFRAGQVGLAVSAGVLLVLAVFVGFRSAVAIRRC